MTGMGYGRVVAVTIAEGFDTLPAASMAFTCHRYVVLAFRVMSGKFAAVGIPTNVLGVHPLPSQRYTKYR